MNKLLAAGFLINRKPEIQRVPIISRKNGTLVSLYYSLQQCYRWLHRSAIQSMGLSWISVVVTCCAKTVNKLQLPIHQALQYRNTTLKPSIDSGHLVLLGRENTDTESKGWERKFHIPNFSFHTEVNQTKHSQEFWCLIYSKIALYG